MSSIEVSCLIGTVADYDFELIGPVIEVAVAVVVKVS